MKHLLHPEPCRAIFRWNSDSSLKLVYNHRQVEELFYPISATTLKFELLVVRCWRNSGEQRFQGGKQKIEKLSSRVELDVTGYGEECGRNLSAGKAVDRSEDTLEFFQFKLLLGQFLWLWDQGLRNWRVEVRWIEVSDRPRFWRFRSIWDFFGGILLSWQRALSRLRVNHSQLPDLF